MTEQKLRKVSEIARGLFINMGYSRAQIRDVAKAAGIATGAVYLLFSGKKALLDFVLKCDVSPGYIDEKFALPIGEDAFPGLESEVMSAFYKSGIRFAEPLTNGADGYPFENMMSDAYDTIARHGASSLIFENNPADYGRLGSFYRQYRQRFYETFLRFVRLYIERGAVRPLAYPEHSARLMVETLCCWAARVPYGDVARDPLSEDERKFVCLDALLRAFRQE